MKKRFLSILTALCLTLTLLPTAALAADEPVVLIKPDGTETVYELPGAAFAASEPGDVVQLRGDISWQHATLQAEKQVTLDLNGHTWNVGTGLTVEGELTVIDSQAGTISVSDDGSYTVSYTSGKLTSSGNTVTAEEGGVFTLESGTVESTGDVAIWAGVNDTTTGTVNIEGGYVVAQEMCTMAAKDSTLNVSGGVLEAKDNAVLAGNGTAGRGGYTINVTGGTLIGRITSSGYVSCGIYHPNDGTVNVSGGTIVSTNGAGIVARAGRTNITGGTIIALGDSATKGKVGDSRVVVTTSGVVLDLEAGYPGAGIENGKATNAQVNISGDPDISGNASAVSVIAITVAEDDNVIITGGTFNTNVSEYCAPGLVAESNGDGTFSITTDSDMTVQVQSADGAVKGAYASLADAVVNAASGDTLVLLADQIPTAEIAIESGKELTLDLAGHLIIPNKASIIVKGGLTVKDSSENGKGEIQTGRQIEVDGGSFTLESGKLSFIGLNSGMYIHSDGTAIVNGGEITGTYSPLSGNNTTGDMNIKINGGTITAENGAAIYMPSQGDLTITGGTLNGGVSLRMGQVNISGGTINATTSGIDNPGEYYNYSGNVFFPDALYVLNGTYTSGDDNSLSLNITGGTFNCANGKGSAVAIYDLGKVGQKSEVQISEDAVLVTNASDRDAYQVLGFDDIGVETPEPGYGETGLIGQVDTAISGGSFSTQIKEEYCAEDFVPVTTKDDNGMYTVTEKEEDGETVTGLTLEPKNLTLTDGETYQLKAGTTPEGSSLTWTSSNTSVVKVNSSGRVTAVGAGTATIKVEAGQLSLTCKVTVKAAPSSSGSSSSEPSYSPKLDVSDGGSIKVNPRTPEEGDEVTITVDPDSGYEVDEVTVTDRNGREVKVTAERDGTYTFTQPRGRVTISVTFVREGGSTFFSDVPESFWAYDEIAWAYDNGYVNGTSASAFSPNASISRQQVWMILARLSGADPANMSAAREWAVTNGVSDGTTPGGAVTRQQLVALLYRYATLMGYANDQRADLSAYPDAGTVAGYAVEPMQWSVANSIVGGTSNGTLDPTGTATRAQFAVILYRFWDQVG